MDSKRNMVETGAVINKLLGPLISDAAFGPRLVNQLWTDKLKNGLKECIDRYFTLLRYRIWYKKRFLIASVTYKGSKDVVRNRAAFNAIECLQNDHSLNI